MSRKNTVVHQLVSAQSLGASFNTDPTLVKNLDNCAYQIIATTANGVGTFSVQASLDYAIDEPTNKVSNSGSWVDLTLSGSPTLASANDDIIINLNQLPFNAIRLTYSRTSGTGTANIYIMAKQIG